VTFGQQAIIRRFVDETKIKGSLQVIQFEIQLSEIHFVWIGFDQPKTIVANGYDASLFGPATVADPDVWGGLKPAAGHLPTEGAFPLSYTLDSVGPIARSVSACAAADAVMAG
jgi:hypothetical protein